MGFETLTLKEALERIPDQDAPWLKANMAFYKGDHWQNGEGWMGPILNSNHPLYQQTVLEIRRQFLSKNAVKEVVGRHTAGVVGKEPAWYVTVRRGLAEGEQPSVEEQALIKEAEGLLVSWWDGQQGFLTDNDELAGAHKVLQSAVGMALLAKRAVLRLFVPPGDVKEGRTAARPASESIRRIFVHQPQVTQASVTVEKRTMEKLGVYVYEEGQQKRAELTFLENGRTVVQIISEGDEKAPVLTVDGMAVDLAGQLTMYELRRELLVTDQVRQLQKGLNLALTMMQRNVVQAGFLERTFFNTQLPGKDIPDPDNPGQTKFQAESLHVGAGVTNFLSGLSYEDAEGNEQVVTPSVVYRDPVKVDTFEMTQVAEYRNILQEVQQLHALISGDATASGESRKQAMADFGQSLLLTKPVVQGALRWLLETVLALTAVLSGQPGRYASLRVNAEARLDVGPLTADEQRLITEQVDKKILSKETGRSKLGIEDTDAEAARVAQEAQGEKTLLSTALLNAQQQLDSGAASTGLEQPSGGATTKGLNGTQISAALNILAGINNGSIKDGTAIELLVALGIDRNKAETMVSAGTIEVTPAGVGQP